MRIIHFWLVGFPGLLVSGWGWDATSSITSTESPTTETEEVPTTATEEMPTTVTDEITKTEMLTSGEESNKNDQDDNNFQTEVTSSLAASTEFYQVNDIWGDSDTSIKSYIDAKCTGNKKHPGREEKTSQRK